MNPSELSPVRAKLFREFLGRLRHLLEEYGYSINTRQHPAGRVARSATLLSKLLRPDCFTVHKLFSSQTAAGRLVESPGNVRPLLSFGIPHLKPAAGRLVESPNLRTPPKLAAGRLVEPPCYLRPLLSIWDPAAGRLVPRTPPAPRRDQLCAYRPITPHMKWNNIIKIVTLKTNELKPWLFPLWIHTIPLPLPELASITKRSKYHDPTY